MEKGKEDSKYVDLMKNKDVFFMDYSSKKKKQPEYFVDFAKRM